MLDVFSKKQALMSGPLQELDSVLDWVYWVLDGMNIGSSSLWRRVETSFFTGVFSLLVHLSLEGVYVLREFVQRTSLGLLLFYFITKYHHLYHSHSFSIIFCEVVAIYGVVSTSILNCVLFQIKNHHIKDHGNRLLCQDRGCKWGESLYTRQLLHR